MPKKIEKKATTKMAKNGQQFKWTDSYTSLVLGILVVIVATILVLTLVKGRGMIGTGVYDYMPEINQEEQANLQVKTYYVKSGENLWIIAEKEYGSGFNWIDIANSNKLSNPDIINEGTKIIIPKKVPQREITNTYKSSENLESISESVYKVIPGDCLWNIAVRAYGDGYKWVEIAKANNLTNPDLIYPGNVFKIPR